MKTNFFSKVASGAIALLIAAGCSFSANAQGYINGDISFTGGATLNGPLATATAFTSIFGPGGTGLPEVLAVGGDYAPVAPGVPANISLFTFIPSPGSSFPLWSFTFGGINYSFQADPTITIDYQMKGFLDISGTGTASISGGSFITTPGTWSIVDTGLGSSPVFTFGAATQVVAPPVPEPSAFALLASFVPIIGAFAYRAKRKV